MSTAGWRGAGLPPRGRRATVLLEVSRLSKHFGGLGVHAGVGTDTLHGPFVGADYLLTPKVRLIADYARDETTIQQHKATAGVRAELLKKVQEKYKTQLENRRRSLNALVELGGNGNVDVVARKQKMALDQLAAQIADEALKLFDIFVLAGPAKLNLVQLPVELGCQLVNARRSFGIDEFSVTVDHRPLQHV